MDVDGGANGYDVLSGSRSILMEIIAILGNYLCV